MNTSCVPSMAIEHCRDKHWAPQTSFCIPEAPTAWTVNLWEGILVVDLSACLYQCEGCVWVMNPCSNFAIYPLCGTHTTAVGRVASVCRASDWRTSVSPTRNHFEDKYAPLHEKRAFHRLGLRRTPYLVLYRM